MNNYINLNGENIYVASGAKSNTARTATYTVATKTLTLNNYKGADIVTNLPGLKVACSNTTGTVYTAPSTAATTPVTISATICTAKEPIKNPETLDPVVGYFALFLISAAILIFRRHLARH